MKNCGVRFQERAVSPALLMLRIMDQPKTGTLRRDVAADPPPSGPRIPGSPPSVGFLFLTATSRPWVLLHVLDHRADLAHRALSLKNSHDPFEKKPGSESGTAAPAATECCSRFIRVMMCG